MSAPPWKLTLTPAAVRSLERLPEKAAAAIVEFLAGPLRENPHRVGGELRSELRGHRSARRGPYRVIYEIDEAARHILVSRIDHRADVYRSR